MFKTTLQHLHCPVCEGPLSLDGHNTQASDDVLTGSIRCTACENEYPILQGVAVLVEDVEDYLVSHVKGVSRVAADSEIPEAIRPSYLEAKADLLPEHIEEDLEADRVTSLYLMSHYLRARHPQIDGTPTPWWAPLVGSGSPLIEKLIVEHWDNGPLQRIDAWTPRNTSLVELGCGVGGLYALLAPKLEGYLGVDSSFASIALARHLCLGAHYSAALRIPGDLLQGGITRELDLKQLPTPRRPPSPPQHADFIVASVTAPPLVSERWKMTAALNMIDMLEEPEALPSLQMRLLQKNGVAIQRGPYIWFEPIARELREKLPTTLRDSASAVEWLYREAGFQIEQSIAHVPWLFFKHVRQLELYSVHLFQGRKSE